MQDARALRAVAWCGALLLAYGVVLQIVFPRAMGPLPASLHTPVLALEIARTPQELETMFGPAGSAERAHWVAQVDHGNALDFVFIVLYGAFLIASLRAFLDQRPAQAQIGIGLSVLACATDAIENACLFSITARLGEDYAGALSALMIATWVKWLSIAATLFLLAGAVRKRGGWGIAAASLAAAALPVAIAAALLRGVFAEVMLLVNTLSFIAIWALVLRTRWIARRRSA